MNRDFRLEISPGSGRDYRVKATNSTGGGQARANMSFPLDEPPLQDHLQVVQKALSLSGNEMSDVLSQQTVQDFGRDLFNALVAGAIRTHDITLHEARKENKGLRIRLHITPPELVPLPWEFLYDERQEEYPASLGHSHHPLSIIALSPSRGRRYPHPCTFWP